MMTMNFHLLCQVTTATRSGRQVRAPQRLIEEAQLNAAGLSAAELNYYALLNNPVFNDFDENANVQLEMKLHWLELLVVVVSTTQLS